MFYRLFENFDGEIPQPIKDLVEFMKKNSINLEGLLRQNGSVKITDNLLTSIIDAKEYDLSKINDEHVVGSVFKRLFRDTISDSLIPDSLIQEFFDIQNEKNELNKLTSIQNLLRKLPEENYSLLKYIVSFLSDVAARSSVNKMNSFNLATCTAPSFFKNGCISIAGGISCAKILEYLIDNRETIFS